MRKDPNELILDKDQRGYVDSRIDDIEGASQRSRILYFLIIATSWLLLAMAYNTTTSFVRTIAEGRENSIIRSATVEAQETGMSAMGAKVARNLVDYFSGSNHGFGALIKRFVFSSSADSRRYMVYRDMLVQTVLKNWVDSLQFEVPVLGARFNAADAGIIGGLLLCILGMFCLFAAKRENHLIYYLIRDCEKYAVGSAFRRYLKNQLHATQLFARSKRNRALSSEDLIRIKDPDECDVSDLVVGDRVYCVSGAQELRSKIQQIRSERMSNIRAILGRLRGMLEYLKLLESRFVTPSQWKRLESGEILEVRQVTLDGSKVNLGAPFWSPGAKTRDIPLNMKNCQVVWREQQGKRWPSALLEFMMLIIVFFLPAIALVVVLGADIATLYMNSPFRDGGRLIDYICPSAAGNPLNCGGTTGRFLASFAFAIICFCVMYFAYRYQRATNSLLSHIDQITWTRIGLPAVAQPKCGPGTT